ncbi:MAG: Fe-S cluster assembly protein SufD [Gammaproteobacteria bacterium]|nr:Fe-S cluster assembly protein SufD [Gammaproteobacteria bacterium]
MTAQPVIENLASQFAPRTAEPDWLGETRRKAIDQLQQQGLPTPRSENWKYTNLRSLHRRNFRPGLQATLAPDQLLPLSTDGYSFLNGVVHEQHPVPGLDAQLVSQALADNGDQLAGQLSALVSYKTHPFAAMNTAFFEDALVINVRAGQKLDRPLMLEFISARAEEPALICPRVLIRIEKDAHCEIIERYIGMPDAENLVSAVTEVHLAQGASLDHYRLQEAAPKETCSHLMVVHQGGDSRLHTHSIDLGGRLVRNDLHSWLCAPGAHAQLSGFYMAVDSQHVDNHTRIDHNAPHTTSKEDYRGVLADQARAVFNGKVLVAPDAQKVDASQSNKNLILSGKAEIDTKPELEIYADDVRCSHGATVGQLDEEALFYMRARGIGERTARALLTFAFAEELLADIKIPDLREYVESRVAHRLPDHDRLGDLV